MKKGDLLDGMVLTFRNQCEALYFKGHVYMINDDIFSREFSEGVPISNWRDDLERSFEVEKDYSIDKVSYQNKVVWTRETLYTIDEAIESGYPFRYKNTEKYCDNLAEAIKELSRYKTAVSIVCILKSKNKDWAIKK